MNKTTSRIYCVICPGGEVERLQSINLIVNTESNTSIPGSTGASSSSVPRAVGGTVPPGQPEQTVRSTIVPASRPVVIPTISSGREDAMPLLLPPQVQCMPMLAPVCVPVPTTKSVPTNKSVATTEKARNLAPMPPSVGTEHGVEVATATAASATATSITSTNLLAVHQRAANYYDHGEDDFESLVTDSELYHDWQVDDLEPPTATRSTGE